MRDALRCVQTLKTLWVSQHLATLFAQRLRINTLKRKLLENQ